MIALRCVACLYVVLVASSSHAQDDAAAREAEALQRAKALEHPGSARLAEFWTRQTAQTTENLDREIIGRFTGIAYGSNFSGVPTVEVWIEFRDDGTFVTNLQCLTTGRAGTYGRMDATVAAAGAEPFAGKYRAVSPSQLILAHGSPVTTVLPSLRDGVLSVYDAAASVRLIIRKEGSQPAPDPGFTAADIAGVYNGAAVPVDAARQSEPVATAAFSLALTDIGTFLPAWLRPGTDESVYPYSYYRGFFAIDAGGALVLAAGIGGNDYGDATIMPFFDWFLDDSTLHFTAFSWNDCSHMAVTLDGSALHIQQPAEFAALTRGKFRGSAFRVIGPGEILEIPDVRMRFDADGTFHSNWSERLSGGDELQPNDTGIFRLFSPRHLVLGYTYPGASGLVADATTDFYLTDDRLCFTSFSREAYFVFKRE